MNMIDAVLSLMVDIVKGLLVGIPSFILGMWYFNKYVLPKMAPEMFEKVIETPKVQSIIKRAGNLLTKLEPFIEKLKELNLEKIDGDLINDALRSLSVEILPALKNLAETFGKKLENPKIPEPAEPTPESN